MSTDPTVVDILNQHQMQDSGTGLKCICGNWSITYREVNYPEKQYNEHLAEAIEALYIERYTNIVLQWQWKDWPLLTPKVKEGSVIGAAQVVTDWLRQQTICSCPLPKVAGCEHDV